MSVQLREKKLSDGRRSLYLDIYSKGKRNYKFLELYLGKDKHNNQEIFRIAEAIKSKTEVDLAYKKTGIPNPKNKQIEFVSYLKSKSNRNIAAKTKEHYLSAYNHLSGFSKNIKLEQVDKKFIEDFQDYLLKKGLHNNTIRGYMQIIRTVLNFAVRDKLIQSNPAKDVKSVKAMDTERHFLTIDELRLLAKTDCLDINVKHAFLFSCFTGLRISDIRSLKWEHILENKLCKRQDKTDGMLNLPLSINSLSILSKQKEAAQNDNFIFTLPKKVPFNKIVGNWIKEAGIKKKITFHCSRHTHALLLLESGSGIYTVSKLLGHKNIKTTEIYAHILDKTKQEAIDRLPEITI